ncbi:amidase [Haloactinopolyspora sp.]|uniref:amidase n=1 Tax=Haloactinopolyspora sp. TaxID=1966353 RepID=UPI002615ACBF|nr:amidase [Haloactinopolyspora sp.]
MTEPADLSAVDLLRAYRAGQLSPVEATQAVLQRIDDTNPELNAFCLVDHERALAAARESEHRWHRGEPVGLLDGVPTSIKDLVLTAGWPTLRGSHLIDPDQSWDEDAPATARLREHGAVLVGKTTSPEFGWKGVTDSPLHGVTGNPWNPQRTAGGSSGGSAAAVARGMGPLSIGTDGGGSIRIPAGFSGIFGIKPTYGRVPHHPASPFGTLAHVGPMTRTVADAALMLDVLALPDPRDWSALPPTTVEFRTAIETPIEGLRIAYSPDLGYVDVDPEVADAVRRAVDVLVRLGAEVEQVDPGFTDPVEAYEALWFSGAAKVVSAFGESAVEKIDPGLAAGVARGRDLTASDYLDATAVRVELGRRMGLFHQRFDLLVTPALPIPAFEAGHDVPPGSSHREWTGWTPFSYPFNLTQQPAASVPCGFTSDGLPIGLQVVGPRHADATVLAACHAYERARS